MGEKWESEMARLWLFPFPTYHMLPRVKHCLLDDPSPQNVRMSMPALEQLLFQNSDVILSSLCV